jgi:hypothetical protein
MIATWYQTCGQFNAGMKFSELPGEFMSRSFVNRIS